MIFECSDCSDVVKQYMNSLIVGNYYIGRKVFEEIFSCLKEPYIVGSTPIHLLVSGGDLSRFVELPDIDIICSEMDYKKLFKIRDGTLSMAIRSSCSDVEGKVGYKFVSKIGKFKFDIWTFDDCYSTNYNPEDNSPNIEKYVKNVHFNVEAVAYNVTTGELIDFGFINSFVDKVIREVNSNRNPERFKERLLKKIKTLKPFGYRISSKLKLLLEPDNKARKLTKPAVIKRY